jgi:hypothetical protein
MAFTAVKAMPKYWGKYYGLYSNPGSVFFLNDMKKCSYDIKTNKCT